MRIFPQLRGVPFEVESTALAGNGWNTRAICHHRIRLDDGTSLACIEKKLGKLPGVAPYEPTMQAAAAALNEPHGLLRVSHLGTIETPLACFLYSEALAGPHAQLARIAAKAGAGLAEREAASAAQLRALPTGASLARPRLDFFQPWTLWRPRYNVALAVQRLALRRDPALAGILALSRRMRPRLRELEAQVRQSARCFSHLDLLSKNFIQAATGLHLIDWGEARVGRFGFDAGSYLHRLLRGNDAAASAKARDIFLESYLARLPADVDRAQVGRNIAWFLAVRSLCYFLRPQVLQQHRAAPRVIEDKLAMLLARLDEAAGAAS